MTNLGLLSSPDLLEILAQLEARESLHNYIAYTSPKYKHNHFSRTVCRVIDQFLLDVQAGLRPIVILMAPPQHGKSEMVSRKLPAYILGKFPDWRVGSASYNADLAKSMGQSVRRNIFDERHKGVFPPDETKGRYNINTAGEFTNPGGEGSYITGGIGSGFTGRSLDIGIIDDPIKNAEEALSPTTKDGVWNWYQTVFSTRLSKNSGQIIMATSWADDDLSGRVIEQLAGDKRLTVLKFPAINEHDEPGYNPELPRGALIPDLHPLEKLLETKAGFSEYWWAALYQQSPRALGGNVFKESGVSYYLPKDLPTKYDKVIASWDCTFKDTDGTDYVVGQVWGKRQADAYLLDQVRARMSFTKTVEEVKKLKDKWPQVSAILIEDKANGPAVIDTLKKQVPGIIAVEPDGSKLARAHAITAYWEACNLHIPHPEICTWVKALVNELLSFPAAANDDQVDAMSQAIRYLYPLFGILKIAKSALAKAAGRAKRN